MASSFPGGLDNFTNPTASDTLDSATVPHATQHANVNDAVEAIESTLGVNPQGASATVVARLGALDTTVAGKAGLSLSNIFTVGAQAIRTGADAVKGLIIQRNSASQTANLLSILQSDGSTEIARMRANGQLGVGALVTNSTLGLDTTYTGDVRFIGMQQVGSASANAIELLNSSGSSVFTVSSTGAITAPRFTGAVTGNVTGNVSGSSGSTTGNAATATILATARTINGTSFNGSANITITATPTDATVTDAKIATAGLAQSSLTSNVIADWAASTSYARNDLVNYLGVAYRRIAAGTSGATFDPANWNAQTPALSAVASNITGIAPSSVTGTAVTQADTGTVTSAMIANGTIVSADIYGSAGITNAQLANSSVSVNGSSVALGSSITVTATPTDGTVTDAKIATGAAIAQSKLALQKYMTLTDSTVDVLPRMACNNYRTLATGNAYFVAYTPEKNITVSNISLSNQVVCVPSSGTNKFQVGIFSAVGSVPSSVTCISFSKKERTTTTTTPAAFGSVGSNTLETFALGYTITNGGSPATNTAPTSVTLTAGTTYWIGIAQYASAGFATVASVMGMTVVTYQVDPYVNLQNAGQSSTDFAVSTAVSGATGAATMPWFRLS